MTKVKNDIIIIDTELLYISVFKIFGMDDEDPWYYDYNSLKKLCNLRNENDKFLYLKERIEKIMRRIIDENLDYDLGHEIKYKYAEEEFGQKIIRFDKGEK